ncbi:hypothetical protein WZ342_2579 [Enterococcus faecalis]|nr:hypothetical protein WZ342_2579 [Enterococcus faecalis]
MVVVYIIVNEAKRAWSFFNRIIKLLSVESSMVPNPFSMKALRV